MCRLVAEDRLAYLESIQLADLRECMLLDLPHQSILRIAASKLNIDLFELVSEYFHDSRFRESLLKEILDDARRSTGSETDALGCIKVRVQSGLGHTSFATHVKLFDVLRRKLQNNEYVSFANRFGFAAYHLQPGFSWNGGYFIELNDLSLSSIGAMMFYGFNVGKTSTLFLLTIPIRILAYTLYLYGKNGLPEGIRHQPWHLEIHREINRLVDACDHPEFVYRHTRHMLMAHEIGHSYSYCDVSPILDIVREAGGDVEELYKGDFPTDSDLNAWARLQAGTGTLRDVSFLFGDLFANLTAIMGGLDNHSLGVMRAFHWWLTRPPKTGQRPRGNVTFLVASCSDPLERSRVLKQLKDIITALYINPTKAADQMSRMEILTWRKVERQFNAYIT